MKLSQNLGSFDGTLKVEQTFFSLWTEKRCAERLEQRVLALLPTKDS